MYTAEYNGQVLHDPRFDDEVIAETTCKLAINTAGSFEASIPPTNPLYSKLAIMSAEREVVLADDGEEVFRGRITEVGSGIDGMQRIAAEGHLAYLNDSIVAPYGTYESVPNDDGVREWDTIAPNNRHDYAEWLIDQHNAQTDASKQYRIGINDLPDVPITRSSTQWPSTKTEITDKLIDDFGCVMSAYMLGGMRYIDFRSDGGKDATQTIEFGVNLLDFARTSRAVDAITCIVPVGKDAAGKEFGLGSLPDGPVGDGMTKQGDRILHEAGVTSCGIIVARKSYDVATLDGLVNACCSDLAASQLAVDSIEISATDLHLIDPSIERIRLGEWVFVSARPLKFEARMMCVSIDIDVSNPGATKYVLGAELPTLTNGNKATAARIRKQESALIERMRPIDQTAKDAAQKATAASELASSANAEAADASEKSDAAITASSSANETARIAKDVANTANTTATDAKNTADTASSTANTAKDTAETAKSTADVANGAATDAKNAATQTASDLSNFATNTNNMLKDMQGQIDGSITTWFFAVPPTNDNAPASDWTTTDLKNNHLGDLYYDTNTGYSYRWKVLQSVYSWQRITDVDVTKALADAAQAQDTADTKRRVFYSQPVPPYDKGDLWSQGANGEMLICATPKTDGMSYLASDWGKASKYTDDAKAIEAAGIATEAAKTATDFIDFGADGLIVGDMTDGALSGNVRIASDGIELRDGASVLARLKAGVLELAANSVNAIIKLCGGKGTIAYYADTNQLAIMSPGSIAMTACQTLPDGTVQPWDAGIACNRYGVVAKGAVEVSGTMSINGQGMSDYVVAQGTSGVWRYRKWASGEAECRMRASQDVSTTIPWGAMFYDGARRGGWALPFVFAEKPNVSIVALNGSWIAMQIDDATTTKVCTFWAVSMGQYTTLPGAVDVSVKGRWK